MTSVMLSNKIMPNAFHEFPDVSQSFRKNISDLAEEIIFKIFSYLPIKDIAAVSQVSRQFYRITRDEELWKDKVKKNRIIWQQIIQMNLYNRSLQNSPSYYAIAKLATESGWLIDVEHYVKVDHDRKTITLPKDVSENVQWKMMYSAFHNTELIKEMSYALPRYSHEHDADSDAICHLFFTPSIQSSVYNRLNVCELSTFHPVDAPRVLRQALSLIYPENIDALEKYVEYKFIYEDGTEVVLDHNI